MLFNIITIIIIIAILVLVFTQKHPSDRFGAAIVGAMLGDVAILVTLMILGTVASAITPSTTDSPTSQNLAALQTQDTIEGKKSGGIFASSGYVEGVQVISYVTKDEDGGIRTGYIPAEDTVIYESSDKQPVIETHYSSKKNDFLLPSPISEETTYTITVPEGSLVESFEIAP